MKTCRLSVVHYYSTDYSPDATLCLLGCGVQYAHAVCVIDMGLHSHSCTEVEANAIVLVTAWLFAIHWSVQLD